MNIDLNRFKPKDFSGFTGKDCQDVKIRMALNGG
jgi:hypothetical protein